MVVDLGGPATARRDSLTLRACRTVAHRPTIVVFSMATTLGFVKAPRRQPRDRFPSHPRGRGANAVLRKGVEPKAVDSPVLRKTDVRTIWSTVYDLAWRQATIAIQVQPAMIAIRCTKPVGALVHAPCWSIVEVTLPAMNNARMSAPTTSE